MTRTAERHRISCPYCVVGFAEIVIERPDGSVQIRDFDEPRRCVTCSRFFKLQYRVNIIGAPLESDVNNGKVATNGR